MSELGVQALKSRVERIEAQIDLHLEQLQGPSIQGMSHDIKDALDDFRRFFHDYHKYFQHDAVAPRPSRNKQNTLALAQPKQRTKERILAAALSNTLPLWETLNRAISQRFNLCFQTDFMNIDTMAQSLFDRFNGYIGEKAPIVYFEKRYHITRFLFQTNPLIGIPLDLVGADSQEAVAHELGHYFFWNSSPLTEYQQRMEALHQAIIDVVLEKKHSNFELKADNGDFQALEEGINTVFTSLRTWLHWVDEIVADVVGTLLCGPSYVISSQDIFASQIDSLSDLLIDDGEHPMPYLRPLIASAVLRLIVEKKGMTDPKFAEAIDQIDQLEARWTQFRDSAGKLEPAVQDHHGHGAEGEPSVSPAELEKLLQPIVEVILTSPLILSKHGARLHSSTASPESIKSDQEALTEEKNLPTTLPEDEQRYVPLIDCIKYWGKDADKIKVSEEMRDVLDKAHELPSLQPHFEQTKQEANAPIPPFDGIPEDSPLHELRQYVLKERERRKALNNESELDTEEWEDLLNLDLDVQKGHGPGTSGWAWHNAWVWHRHINGRAECT